MPAPVVAATVHLEVGVYVCVWGGRGIGGGGLVVAALRILKGGGRGCNVCCTPANTCMPWTTSSARGTSPPPPAAPCMRVLAPASVRCALPHVTTWRRAPKPQWQYKDVRECDRHQGLGVRELHAAAAVSCQHVVARGDEDGDGENVQDPPARMQPPPHSDNPLEHSKCPPSRLDSPPKPKPRPAAATPQRRRAWASSSSLMVVVVVVVGGR